ncbi:alpha-L-rhamnosidase-related protein [Flavicella sediminum]|uniref:alpha-L-rhamnosidase-related protein n=1 Tax=Flavicella sediminum TaxID=2585141 RepID=UPI001121B3E5|nr:alpha-L-rhamnosidase C-terminal domain-containing protein [Flavicella sediminum]
MRTIKYLSLFLLIHLGVFAQESKATINVEGKDFNQLKHAWTAQWITHPTESTLDARMFLFRKKIDLDRKPDKFIVHVSADNRYRLYVNGSYIVSGPSSSDINNYRYETLDIAPYLTAGKNIIATEVVNFGEYRKAASMTFQTAFIMQGDEENPVDINTSNKSDWKVVRDFGFESIPFVSDSLRGYYAAGPGEKRITKKTYKNWKKKNFDDSNWLIPKAGTVEFAVGRGFLFGSTWYLVPRTIPFLEESLQRFGKIARVEGMKMNDNFIKGTGALTIPANKKVTLLIDQEHHTIGHPEFNYSKGKGSKIKITYSEAMYTKDWKKGNRNIVKDKHILGYYDIIIADGSSNNMFKPIGQKTYRFIELEIDTKDEPLIIEDYYGVYTAYPFKENAVFETENKTLSKIWDASWLTLRNSAVENFIDPYYEQLQYVGDARIEALVSISVDGDDRQMRKAIEMFDNSRLPNGLTQSRYPSYIVQVIPTYSLLWIDMIHDYHRFRNDSDFVKKFTPGIKTVLNWWANKVNKTGMPTGMEWWNFTDWSPGFHNGIPDGADDGYSSSIALQLVQTLQNTVTIFTDLGMLSEAKKYDDLQKKILKSVQKNCFVPEKGMFAETPNKLKFSQHTNILAILTDAIPKKNQKDLMQKIISDSSLIQTTIYYKFYLFNALQKSGLGDTYVNLLQNWTNQLEQGLTTFAETDIEPRSECHAWSASPNYHFLTLIAGIQPASKNFEKITIAPNLGELKNLRAKMPHPNGFVEVTLTRKNKAIKGEISLPKGSTGIFIWNGKKITLKEGNQKIKLK